MTFPSGQWALLTTHFGDVRWLELLVSRVRAFFPELPDERIFVIDQDRTADSAATLTDRVGPVQILSYEPSRPHIVMTGHDHAHVLNLAVREIDAETLLIFDSDAHPVSIDARERLTALAADHDAVLAALGPTGIRTHPCFLLLGPKVERGALRFDEGQLETGVDTGRLIGQQIEVLGLRATFLRPEAAFEGRWGTTYLGGSLYHHGSASFASAADPRLRAQAALWRRDNAFFERRVFDGRYTLTRWEQWLVRANDLRASFIARLEAARRRLLLLSRLPRRN